MCQTWLGATRISSNKLAGPTYSSNKYQELKALTQKALQTSINVLNAMTVIGQIGLLRGGNVAAAGSF